jgi:hypothetical protein
MFFETILFSFFKRMMLVFYLGQSSTPFFLYELLIQTGLTPCVQIKHCIAISSIDLFIFMQEGVLHLLLLHIVVPLEVGNVKLMDTWFIVLC